MQIDTETIEVADQQATENQTGNLSEDDLLNFLSNESTEAEVTETQEDPGASETETEEVLSQSESDDTEEVALSQAKNEDDSAEDDSSDSDHEEDDEPEVEQPKSIQKLLKQVSRLTARAKSSEELVESLKSQLDQLNVEKKVEENPTLEEATTLEQLEQIRQEALSAKKWARQNEDESYVKEGDREYTRAEIKKIRDNAEEHLEELIPERMKFLQVKQQSDALLKKDFKFLGETDSYEGKLWSSIQKDPKLKVLDKLPNGNYLKALMVEGAKSLQLGKQPVKTAKAKKPKPNPPTSPNSDVSPPTRNTGSQSDRRKKILGDSNISEEQLTAFLTQP